MHKIGNWCQSIQKEVMVSSHEFMWMESEEKFFYRVYGMDVDAAQVLQGGQDVNHLVQGVDDQEQDER